MCKQYSSSTFSYGSPVDGGMSYCARLDSQSSMIRRPAVGQFTLMLDAIWVIKTWCGRNADVGVRGNEEGVKRARERTCDVATNDWGDRSRRVTGRVARSGGEAYTVDSRVMRRMSHLRR